MPVLSKKGLLIGIPTLGRPINLEWAMAFRALSPPINYNAQTIVLKNRPVDEARNTICKYAMENDFKYVFFLGDDVVPPFHALQSLIYKMEMNQNVGVCGGIYVTKNIPSFPLVFRGNGAGSFWDWRVGEFFEVTGIGMDCTLIRVDTLKAISEPLFKTVDSNDYLDGVFSAESWTEDLYFCNKVLSETDYKIYADGAVLCEHWDTINNKVYTLSSTSVPAGRLLADGRLKLLDIGCGAAPYEDPNYQCIHVDVDDYPHVDFRCDVRSLPFGNEEFDVIRASHVLEHFGRHEVKTVFSEWLRVLKPNGTVILVIPDIQWAFENFDNYEKAMNVLYGAQDTQWDIHKIGFTENSIKDFLSGFNLVNIEITKDNYNMTVIARKHGANMDGRV